MPREAKLSKKKVGKHTYWCTRVGGDFKPFGNVKEVSRTQAYEAFIDYRKSLLANPTPIRSDLTVGELCELYLIWSRENLSAQNCAMKESCLTQWCGHVVGSGASQYSKLSGAGKFVGELTADKITSQHLDDFIAARRRAFRLVGISAARLTALKKRLSISDQDGKVNVNSAIKARLLELEGIGDNSARKIIERRPFKAVDDIDAVFYDESQPVGPTMLAADQTQVMAAWRWGVEVAKKLPPNCQPFRGVRKVKIPQPLKLEAELPTGQEVKLLYKAAAAVPGFVDLLRCYYAIGPRTGELAEIRVADVELGKAQVTLGKHKRSTTMTDPKARTLTLNTEAAAIFRRLCNGKKPHDWVFTQPNGMKWNTDRLDKTFKDVRVAACVRRSITLYSFRHLWISDQLQAGTEIVLIADMAGTSIRQIERTYGHIRTAQKADAQRKLDEMRAQKQVA